ncbi:MULTISPECIES: hypothetical protein [Sphingobacterium]|uniref:hypothetical protein n=1 Tax=Sphingobacterium TaxID=28453 RepID=UPI00104FB648|nr:MULTISPECIES: hypothetical protein [Sphingobacterium]MCW2258771.1 hypothetical protein [Sphingobacterium kitahiroshimense]TCR14775.1 hypothetical protein EDF67_101882 [Sphingobacterium sp. JUb78]
MNRYYKLLPLAIILLASACQKTETLEENKVEVDLYSKSDSVSFYVNGKHYTTEVDSDIEKYGYRNGGANLRLSDTKGKWTYGSAGKDLYWVGAPDSIQYSTSYTNYFPGGSIEFNYVKNYKEIELVEDSNTLVPRKDKIFYKVGKYDYAMDFKRRNWDEGVAIELSLKDLGGLTSFSTLANRFETQLNATSQNDSKFEILKVEEIKGTKLVIIEGKFEVNLFDDQEQKVVRVTDGYFRSKVYRSGNRSTY